MFVEGGGAPVPRHNGTMASPSLTIKWIAANCAEFVSEDEWIQNSPDLNPLP